MIVGEEVEFYSAYYNGAFHIDNLKISVRA
jgi:hypothetical protein